MAKSILNVSSTKLSNDIDDYLSDDFTDEDLTPPDEDGIKPVNHAKCDKKENGGDDKYYDDMSYSDDDSILSQERFENSLKASGGKTTTVDKNVEKDEKVHSNKDGPRILSSEEEIRYELYIKMVKSPTFLRIPSETTHQSPAVFLFSTAVVLLESKGQINVEMRDLPWHVILSITVMLL